MNPIDKFTDIECIYNFVDKEERYTEYVWKLAMYLKPAQEDDEPFECCKAMPIFKQRYNDRLIKMPWSYEEYLKNKDIQTTINGLGFDKEKFWFALLFIYDYCEGECRNSQEYGSSAYYDLQHLAKVIQNNLRHNSNPLEEKIYFNKEVRIDIIIDEKVVATIDTPNAIKYLADSSAECCKKLDNALNIELNPMFSCKIKEERIFESENYHIYLFTTLFKRLFRNFEMPKSNKRSRISGVSYSKTFLISKLIYLTRISRNQEFYYEPSTLKGYISRWRNRGIKGKINKFYY